MPRVGIAERTEFLMVAADERGAGVNSRRSFHHTPVELQAEIDHGFGFVDVGSGKKRCSGRSKNLLRRREDQLVILAASGNVKQAK